MLSLKTNVEIVDTGKPIHCEYHGDNKTVLLTYYTGKVAFIGKCGFIMVSVAMNKRGMMMGPMKGHLAPNSSPFKPTINKLSSQYLIQDHMSSHYHKLATVKSAIDSTSPKSMQTSVKKRDQMKREAMAKQMKFLDFEKGMKYGTSPKHTPDGFSAQRSFSVTVTKNGYDEIRPRSSSSSLYSAPGSVRSRSSSLPSAMFDNNSPKGKPSSTNVLDKTYGGDYLDRHSDKFKNADAEFTPRTKKRQGRSYLVQSKHYAPPLTLNKDTKKKRNGSARPEVNVRSASSVSSGSFIIADVQDSSGNRVEERSWTDDQAEIVQRLNLEESRHTFDNTSTQRWNQGFQSMNTHKETAPNPFFGLSSLGKTFTSRKLDTSSYETKYRIQAEEEEMKYLEFINSVTNDILTRGIYSDRVLTQVMERHMEQNRGRLDTGRMRHMLMKLQEDLGISSTAVPLSYSTSPKTTYSETGRSSSRKTAHAESRKKSTSVRDSSDERPESHTSTVADVGSRKKKSARKIAASTSERSVHMSGSESDGGSIVKKGILKHTGQSSGSEQDVRSVGLSSGDEHSDIVVDGPKSNIKKKSSSPRQFEDEFEGSEHNSITEKEARQENLYKAAKSSPKSPLSSTHSMSNISKSSDKSHPEENEIMIAEDNKLHSDHENQNEESEISDGDF